MVISLLESNAIVVGVGAETWSYPVALEGVPVPVVVGETLALNNRDPSVLKKVINPLLPLVSLSKTHNEFPVS